MSNKLVAQQPSNASSTSNNVVGFDGQIVLTTNGEFTFLNFGGPGVKIKKGVWTISLNMLPSLRFHKDAKAPLVTPSLGTGVQLYYKRLILCGSTYYVANRNYWIVTGGLGFKLSK
ncbi:MAG: hypothetical protein NZ521_08085 [Flammeovirgaceae bacterium]|nr:hypothetical protein [Flammeovirgaceae bacterium]MDW8288169.1 hypothetical protein [Flammeovirgaceae bacterium]